jgi:ribosomal protein L24
LYLAPEVYINAKKTKMPIKIGDTVAGISGFHKNETGKLLKLIKNRKKEEYKELILSLNILNQIQKWVMKQFEAPIHQCQI